MVFVLSWMQQLLLGCSLLALASGESRILQDVEEDRTRTDLVRLVPFDVQLALTTPFEDVNIYALTDIVTDWMDQSFKQKSRADGVLNNNTSYSSIALELASRRNRNLQDEAEPGSTPGIGIHSVSYDGISLWERTGTLTAPMDPELVELIQRATFLEGKKLLELLQEAEEYTGLGPSVVDVRAYITPSTPDDDTDGGSDEGDKNLEIIIIIAIVVACLAFGLLMFAVIWAWRTDQSKQTRETTKTSTGGSLGRSPDGTGSESYDNEQPASPQAGNHMPHHVQPQYNHRPPEEIPGQSNYPESVISEDISTSLTAYYRSGMGAYNPAAGNTFPPHKLPPRELNDAASMSSMDSYGYSLDGYAPSLTGVQMGYPASLGPGAEGRPVNGQIKDPNDDTDAESDMEGMRKLDPDDVMAESA